MLRQLLATASAVAVGIVRTLVNRRAPLSVDLAPGAAAPDFVLTGSDGRTYRLSDFRGESAVVIAWFPKAFTGG